MFFFNSYDYTKGKLGELVDIIIAEKASLFVSAVGVPPKAVVEKLHSAGILCMNMIGHPKHVAKCLDVGVDIICAQGGEGGGHTGDVPTTVLIPTVAKLVQGKKSPLTGQPVQVIAAGGLFNGNSVAAALMLGASAVWIGTRFILSDEAGAPKAHQEAVRTSGFEDNIRTIIFTVGLPCLSVYLGVITNRYYRVVPSVFARTLTSSTGRRTVTRRSSSSLPRVLFPSSTTWRTCPMTSTTTLLTTPALT
jgi:NAD(P)H-dependent flavin oxidoreductase YrpB (nitropropane dioxygenase family)